MMSALSYRTSWCLWLKTWMQLFFQAYDATEMSLYLGHYQQYIHPLSHQFLEPHPVAWVVVDVRLVFVVA